MRRAISLGLILIINLVLQSTVFQNIAILGVAPNTAIIIIVSVSLLRGSTEGSLCGLFAGFLQDVFFGTTIGFYSLLGMICGHITGKFNKGFYRENYIMPVFICVIATFVYESLAFALGPLFYGVTNYFYFALKIILPEIVYNAVFTFVIYRILFSINEALELNERHKHKLFSIK